MQLSHPANCYLCHTNKYVGNYVSDLNYEIPMCASCVLNHLGYEAVSEDGKLSKVVGFNSNYDEYVAESGKRIKYIAI